MADENALFVTSIEVDTSTGVAELKKFENTVDNLAKKVDDQVKKMDGLGGVGKKGAEGIGLVRKELTKFDLANKSLQESRNHLDKLDEMLAQLGKTGKDVGTGADGVEKLKKYLDDLDTKAKEAGGSDGGLNQVGVAAESLGDKAASFFKLSAAIYVAYKALKFLGDFMREGVGQALQAEVAVNDLSLAIKAQGRNAEESLPRLEALASSLSRVTLQSDNAVLGVERTLIAIGGLSGRRLEDATKATLDLAKGMGIGLESAARLMARAAEGSVVGLTRYGLHVKAGADDTEKFAATLAFVRTKFGGFAEGELQTTSGALSKLTLEWTKLKEVTGAWLLQLVDVKSLAQTASGAVQTLSDQMELGSKGGIGFWKSILALTMGGPGSLTQLNAMTAALKASLDPLPQAYDAAGTAAEALAKKQLKWNETLDETTSTVKKTKDEVAFLQEQLKGRDAPSFVKATEEAGKLRAGISAISASTQLAVDEAVAHLERLGVKMSEVGADGTFKFTATPDAAAKQAAAPEIKTPENLRLMGIQPDKNVPVDTLAGTGSEQVDLLKDRIREALKLKDADLTPLVAELDKLSAAINGVDDKDRLRAVKKRLEELQGLGFKGELLQAKVGAELPGSKGAEEAQLKSFDFQAQTKVAAIDPTNTIGVNKLIEAQMIERQSMIDGFNRVRLDKELAVQQQLLDAVASAAPRGSDERFAAEIAAFDNKANQQYEIMARSGAKTEDLVESFQIQRDARFQAHADARIAIEQNYQQRAIQIHVGTQSTSLEDELQAAREMFDFKANLEVEAAVKAGLDTTELYKLLIREREALDAGYVAKAVQIERELQTKLLEVRRQSIGNSVETNNAISLEGYVADAQAQWEAFKGTEAQREQLAQALNDGYASLAEEQAVTAEDMYLRIIDWSSIATQAQTEDLNSIATAASGAANIMLATYGKLHTAMRNWTTMDKKQKLAAAGEITQATGAAVQASFGQTKAGQYAATVINTAGAIMSAMTLPWPANLIMAALAGAMGAVQLAKIKSTTLEGGGSASTTVPSMPSINYDTAKGQGRGEHNATGTNALLVGPDSAGSPNQGITINIDLHALDEKNVREYLTSPEIRQHVAEAYDLQKSRG